MGLWAPQPQAGQINLLTPLRPSWNGWECAAPAKSRQNPMHEMLRLQPSQAAAAIRALMPAAASAIASALAATRHLRRQFNLGGARGSSAMAPKRAREGAAAATKPSKAVKAEPAALPDIEDFTPTDVQQVGAGGAHPWHHQPSLGSLPSTGSMPPHTAAACALAAASTCASSWLLRCCARRCAAACLASGLLSIGPQLLPLIAVARLGLCMSAIIVDPRQPAGLVRCQPPHPVSPLFTLLHGGVAATMHAPRWRQQVNPCRLQ